MEFLVSPFEVSSVSRALLAGILSAILCACAGTWVVLRGLAFCGSAISHGMLPGVAVGSLLGGHLLLGAAAGALVMTAGIAWVARRSKLSQDLSIGLLFIGMLALGVIIVSRSQSFAVDLTGFLFGDVLGVGRGDLLVLAVAAALGVGAALILHRPFLALAFDECKASTLGLRPAAAHSAMLALTALAAVASFRIVGTLLVIGLLLGPPATAFLVVSRVPGIIVTAAAIGVAVTYSGLLISWYAATSAGATIAFLAVAVFVTTLVAKWMWSELGSFSIMRRIRNKNGS